MAFYHPAVQRAYPPQHPGHAREYDIINMRQKKTQIAYFRCHFLDPNESLCTLPSHFLGAIHEHMKFKRQQSSLEGFLQTNLFADIKGHRG